ASRLRFERFEESRFERVDFDLSARDLVLYPGITIGASVARHLAQAIERAQRMDRRAGADALLAEQRRADRPAFADLAEDIADRHHDIVEEHLAELVIARESDDTARRHAGRLGIDEHQRDRIPRLWIAAGAHEQIEPIGIMRAGGPDLVAVDDELVALDHGFGAETAQIGARARLGIALRPDHFAGARLMQMLRLLFGRAVFDEDRTDMGKALRRKIGRANAG